MDDPGCDAFKRDLLEKARAAFPRFYASSTIDDRFHFDGLVFARAAAAMALIIPRSPFPYEQRLAMERDSDKAERFFLLHGTGCRHVRRSPRLIRSSGGRSSK